MWIVVALAFEANASIANSAMIIPSAFFCTSRFFPGFMAGASSSAFEHGDRSLWSSPDVAAKAFGVPVVQVIDSFRIAHAQQREKRVLCKESRRYPDPFPARGHV
jgi:hypothetical protein